MNVVLPFCYIKRNNNNSNNNSNNSNSNSINNETQADYLFKILIVGGHRVGQSSIIKRYCFNSFLQHTDSTIGVDLAVKNIRISNKLIRGQLWDISRTQGFRSLFSSYFRYSKGIIFVYDITNKKSLWDIKDYWFELFTRKGHVIPDKEFDETVGYDYTNYKPVKLLIGIKADLRDQSNYNQCVDTDTAREFAQSIGALFFESSSKDNINIYEPLDEFINQIRIEYERSNGKTQTEIQSLKTPVYHYQHSFKLTPLNNKK